MIMWLVGLSGAGKTTLAEAIVKEVRERLPNIALLDGDVLRLVWGSDLGHTLEDRLTNADRMCRLGAYLETQNIHAVVSILSIFEQSRKWNRNNLRNYYEVYLKTPLTDLVKRDVKGLYRRAAAGEIELPGVNLDFPEPAKPDEIIDNNGTLDDLLAQSPRLASFFF